MVKNDLYFLFKRHFVSIEMNFGILWRLIGIVNAGEVLDLTCPSFLIKTLRVAFLSHGQRAVDEYLDKFETGRLVQSTYFVPIALIRADEARQLKNTSIAEQLRDLTNAANILCSIRF